MTLEPDVAPLVGAQLTHAARILQAAGSLAPRDDALALLACLLDAPTAVLLAQSERRLSPRDVQTYGAWTARRAAGEATAHITGHLTFMGLDLTVGRDGPLVPLGAQRLVGVALDCVRHGGSGAPDELLAAEVGTGCGAIALALAAFEPRFTRIYAMDPSAEALRAAAANGARYLLNLVISWIEGDSLEHVPEPVDLIVDADAADAGSQRFVAFVDQAATRLRPSGTLVCRLAHGQEEAAAAVLARALPQAPVWTQPQPEGVIVVAQVPRSR